MKIFLISAVIAFAIVWPQYVAEQMAKESGRVIGTVMLAGVR